ncbi:hypothetical protein P7H22_26685 [Paenibacillus larvae]|nr:hypothetical protein [Paenibacillus larvae]MDT2243192.1 hypothetical protein [Paenibacillus larvae]
MEPIKPYLQKGMKWVGDTFAKLPKVLGAVGETIKGFFSAFSTISVYDHFDNLAYLFQNGFDEQMQRVTVNYLKMFGMSDDQARSRSSLASHPCLTRSLGSIGLAFSVMWGTFF